MVPDRAATLCRVRRGPRLPGLGDVTQDFRPQGRDKRWGWVDRMACGNSGDMASGVRLRADRHVTGPASWFIGPWAGRPCLERSSGLRRAIARGRRWIGLAVGYSPRMGATPLRGGIGAGTRAECVPHGQSPEPSPGSGHLGSRRNPARARLQPSLGWAAAEGHATLLVLPPLRALARAHRPCVGLARCGRAGSCHGCLRRKTAARGNSLRCRGPLFGWGCDRRTRRPFMASRTWLVGCGGLGPVGVGAVPSRRHSRTGGSRPAGAIPESTAGGVAGGGSRGSHGSGPPLGGAPIYPVSPRGMADGTDRTGSGIEGVAGEALPWLGSDALLAGCVGSRVA